LTPGACGDLADPRPGATLVGELDERGVEERAACPVGVAPAVLGLRRAARCAGGLIGHGEEPYRPILV
jgi:hypothetical protein